jgi:hypothetical protein
MISPGFRLFEFFFIYLGGAKPLLSTCRRLVHFWPVIGLTPLLRLHIYTHVLKIFAYLRILSAYIFAVYTQVVKEPHTKKILTAVAAKEACMLGCMPAAAALLLLLYLFCKNMKSQLETEPGSRNLKKS